MAEQIDIEKIGDTVIKITRTNVVVSEQTLDVTDIKNQLIAAQAEVQRLVDLLQQISAAGVNSAEIVE